MNQSILIKKLTDHEISILKIEIENNSNLWSNHCRNLEYTALKDGKSIHLQWIKDDLSIVFERWNMFPNTKKSLNLSLNQTK